MEENTSKYDTLCAAKDKKAFAPFVYDKVGDTVRLIIVRDSLMERAEIPEGVTEIGYGAFASFGSLTEISLPSTLRRIGNEAFSGCSLAHIPLPEGLASIGEHCFAWADKLQAIRLPASLTEIGYAPFLGCKSLTEITVEDGNTAFSSLSGDLYSKDGKTLICVAPGKVCEQFTPNDGVTVIGHGALSGSESLCRVTLPQGVTSVGNHAFAFCSRLDTVSLSEGITELGRSAFGYCRSLNEVTLPEGLTRIGEGAFYACGALRSVTIPSTLTSIEGFAFDQCDRLTDVYYRGTKKQWKRIAFDKRNKGNKPLLKAKIHFEYKD